MPTPQTPPVTKTEMISFRGTLTLKDLLDRLARRDQSTRSDLIRETLERSLPTTPQTDFRTL